jgi:hypothetical protein
VLFHDVTLEAGDLVSRRVHDTGTLAPEAVRVFTKMLRVGGDHFRKTIPVPGLGRLELSWTSETRGAAMATFWSGGKHPLTTSALLSGLDPAADAEAAQALQGLALQLFRGTPIEPGFSLRAIAERPLIASLIVPALEVHPDLAIVADMETCLAAAFFLEVLT